MIIMSNLENSNGRNRNILKSPGFINIMTMLFKWNNVNSDRYEMFYSHTKLNNLNIYIFIILLISHSLKRILNYI